MARAGPCDLFTLFIPYPVHILLIGFILIWRPFIIQGGEKWPLKDGELARRNREDGNAAFQSGNHELALVLYTEAMRYSPVHPTTHEGEDFATAAANRSAALMALGKFEECLEDVQLAIEAGYTSAASYKLFIRQGVRAIVHYRTVYTVETDSSRQCYVSKELGTL